MTQISQNQRAVNLAIKQPHNFREALPSSKLDTAIYPNNGKNSSATQGIPDPGHQKAEHSNYMIRQIESLVSHFEPISLQEMDRVSLLNRTDTKYLLGARQLWRILEQIQDCYSVLTIEKICLNRYETLYFDTPDFALYKQHQSGRLNRYKVRYRKYLDSNLCYLEVKFKNNKRRTIKKRLETPDYAIVFGGNRYMFVQDNYPFDPRALEPKIRNSFLRMTLVSKQRAERLTIDFNLQFHNEGTTLGLPGIVIAEVKQEKFLLNSDFMQQMRANNLYPTGFSKYCIGTAKMYPQLKDNRFKPKFLLLNKLTNTR